MDNKISPKISVGLPVYNGDKYLQVAIESILSQTYNDFELIISDNASNDRTAAICQQFAERDSRVRYYRQTKNIGAAANYNYVFELARGKYFKWAAHDDLIESSFLARCIAALECDPGAILCRPLAKILSQDHLSYEKYNPEIENTGRDRPSQHFLRRLQTLSYFEIFGLIRSDILRRTELIRPYAGTDRVLLAELALCGRFITVPEFLFTLRQHPSRSAALKNPKALLAWYAPDQANRRICQEWARYAAYLRMIRRQVTKPTERLRCYANVVQSLGSNWNIFLLMIDPVVSFYPGLFPWARKQKRRLFGYKTIPVHETAPVHAGCGTDSISPMPKQICPKSLPMSSNPASNQIHAKHPDDANNQERKDPSRL